MHKKKHKYIYIKKKSKREGGREKQSERKINQSTIFKGAAETVEFNEGLYFLI